MAQFDHINADVEPSWGYNRFHSGPFIWLFNAPEKYLVLQQQRQPFALVTFAYYGVMLHQLHSYWWAEGCGKSIVGAVDECLGPYWSSWMDWPKHADDLVSISCCFRIRSFQVRCPTGWTSNTDVTAQGRSRIQTEGRANNMIDMYATVKSMTPIMWKRNTECGIRHALIRPNQMHSTSTTSFQYLLYSRSFAPRPIYERDRTAPSHVAAYVSAVNILMKK
ncbi:hypothetical protein EJ07DRAFT_154476 [Lizonia empirigonia]|nr:hypothetical protein EJ07DRAFT_154476 [Lizonia empirigonia]